jgi:hypothetical protein
MGFTMDLTCDGRVWRKFIWLRIRHLVGSMYMKDENGLGLALLFVQQAVLSAYENNFPLKPVQTEKHSLKWTSELEYLRREVIRLYISCRADRTPQSWALYTEAQRRYTKEVRKTSKDAWRTFCNSVNDLPMSARLYRDISCDPKIKLGSLLAPSCRHTQSEGKTLELLLATRFPNSLVTAEVVAPAAARSTKCFECQVAPRVAICT